MVLKADYSSKAESFPLVGDGKKIMWVCLVKKTIPLFGFIIQILGKRKNIGHLRFLSYLILPCMNVFYLQQNNTHKEVVLKILFEVTYVLVFWSINKLKAPV